MWPYVIAIGVILLVVGLYVLTYKWNEDTEKPEGCEELECTSCKAQNCSHRKSS